MIRGQQSDLFLKLSYDRKVSPTGSYQASRNRWIPATPNSFGLPAGTSCPGRTPFCRSCYAVGSERSAGVRELVDHNLDLLRWARTVHGMAEFLDEAVDRYRDDADRQGIVAEDRIFRIHWDGDFFSLGYAAAWAQTIHDNPDIAFWAYTRSFVDPVNVVPILDGLPNLELYLSVDAWNTTAAQAVLAAYPRVHGAWCAVDYIHAKAIAGDRPTVACPENAGRMALMTDGRGACVECRICPDGRRDILFATSHRRDVDVAAPTRRPARPAKRAENMPVSIPRPGQRPSMRRCAYGRCGRALPVPSGRGRPRKYCSDDCRIAAGGVRQ